jgi:two-component system CheB/CheR fusion protein
MANRDETAIFEDLLLYLQQSRGFDFTGYKRSSLMRRVRKQMLSHELESFSDYLDYLQVHPEEFEPLLNTILINVTAFFRDDAAWQYLRAETLPILFKNLSATEPLRIWSAGCASGEEAYTLAMLSWQSPGPRSNFASGSKSTPPMWMKKPWWRPGKPACITSSTLRGYPAPARSLF